MPKIQERETQPSPETRDVPPALDYGPMVNPNDPLCAYVTFEGTTKEYSYHTFIEGLVPGDRVVVVGKKGISLVTFKRYGEASSITSAWLIAKVDQKSMDYYRASRAAQS